ncbi:hypothetical protein TYRP_009859 [Tyrophagus putrescentiae]|nr:hypothetical protein TYRP_009859 [Tyrophagus putrescentiae]
MEFHSGHRRITIIVIIHRHLRGSTQQTTLDDSSHLEEPPEEEHLTEGHRHEEERLEAGPEEDAPVGALVDLPVDALPYRHVLLLVLHRRQAAGQLADLRLQSVLTGGGGGGVLVLCARPLVPTLPKLLPKTRTTHRPFPTLNKPHGSQHLTTKHHQ